MTTMVELLLDLVTRDQLRCTYEGGRKLSSLFATDEALTALSARGVDVQPVPQDIRKLTRLDFDKFSNRVALTGAHGLATGMSANDLHMGLIGIGTMPVHAIEPTGRSNSR